MAAQPNPPGSSLSPQQPFEADGAGLSHVLREVSRLALGDSALHFRGLVTCGYPVDFRNSDWVEAVLVEGLEGPEVRLTGVRSCDSPWACPVCAPRLGIRRSEALARLAGRVLSLGYRVAHAVLTLRHHRFESLQDTFGLLQEAWRLLRRNRRMWEGVEYARAVEVTFGIHGWHPHVHLLLVTLRDPYALEEALWEGWSEAVASLGGEVRREAFHFQVLEGEEDVVEVSRYVAKSAWSIGHEAAGGALKGGEGAGLAPRELLGVWWGHVLELWAEGGEGRVLEVYPWLEEGGKLRGVDLLEEPPLILREFCRRAGKRAEKVGLTPEEAATRWVEWAEATKGAKALTLSRALNLLYRQALEEVEGAEESAQVLEVVLLRRSAYLWLLRTGRIGYWVALATALRSLSLACELLGLVEGEEWDVDPRGPPGDDSGEKVGHEVRA